MGIAILCVIKYNLLDCFEFNLFYLLGGYNEKDYGYMYYGS